MGAEFWQHQTPYRPDAATALQELQAAIFRDVGYDLARYLPKRIAEEAEAVRACEQDDPHNLLETYLDGLRRLREIEARGIPQDPASRIALLREIQAVGSGQAPEILAVTGVSTGWEEWKARVLPPEEIKAFFGTATPSDGEVEAGVDRLTQAMHRAMAACFPVYWDGQPESWYFIGYSGD